MTVVSKASAFPKSVQPGIPALGPKPMGWLRGPLSAHLFEQQRPIRMSDDAEYRLVTVKRSRGGVVTREHLKGREISVKSQFLLHPGDFLISKRQIVHGACGIVPAELEGSIASNEYAILRGKPTVDLKFLNYLAHSIYFQQTCFHSSIGVHVEKMIFKLDRWLSWDFDLPPLPEQRKIAEILSTWDAAIGAQERLVANARAQKKALMQTLLPTGAPPLKRRLPGFEGEWRSVCLGDIGKLRKGKGIQRDQVRAMGFPCIRYGEIYTQHHEQVRQFHSFIDAETAAESEPISAGDILFTCSGETAEEIGKCVAYLGSEKAFAGGDIIILSPTADNAAFLGYVLNDTDVAEQKRRFGQGNSVVHISAANLSKLTFRLPSRAEQDGIVSVLDDATIHIDGLAVELGVLRQEKSALMQQLLTGKRRVRVEEAA